MHDIATMAFSTLTPLTVCRDGPVEEVVRDIRQRKGIKQTQVLLLWALQTTSGPLVT